MMALNRAKGNRKPEKRAIQFKMERENCEQEMNIVHSERYKLQVL